MEITKILKNAEPLNLNDYYNMREDTVKLCNERMEDDYKHILSNRPLFIKIEKNISIQNNFTNVVNRFDEHYRDKKISDRRDKKISDRRDKKISDRQDKKIPYSRERKVPYSRERKKTHRS